MKNKLLVTIIALCLGACSSLTDIDTTVHIKLPDEYEQANRNMTEKSIARWWQTWDDEQLQHLIELGLQQNRNIHIAKGHLDEVNAILRVIKADLYPSLMADALSGVGHTDISSTLGNRRNIEINNTGRLLIGGLAATWEPDVWGQKQSDIDALAATALAAKMQTYGAQMLVASRIAESYLRAKYNLAKQALLKRTVATLAKLQRYVQGRFDAGQATAYDLRAIETQIQAVKAQQTTLTAEFSAYQRSLAVLTGQIPQDFHLSKRRLRKSKLLSQLPLPPNGEQPQNLLNKRPDLMAAAAKVQSKAASLASAKADFLPRFDLRFLWQTGRLELSSQLIPGLNGWNSLASFGIQLPIFTAGKIQANVDAKDAALKTALLEYEQAILQALAEVDNRYQLQYALNRQTNALARTVQKSQRRQVSAQKLFTYGDKTLDSVLDVRLKTLQYQQKLLQSRLAKALNLIALYKSIGSGWEESL